MTDTRLADISEFQQDIDARAYLGGGYSCLIVRAHNGWRPDNLWPARRDYLRGYPFTCLGYYQYLVASRDPSAQAREFIATVGKLRDNEFVILDLEEGAGYQAGRAMAWFAIVDPWAGMRATLYSGLSFCRDHLAGWDQWNRPRWLAAYQSLEPPDAHELWQNTDSARFPGIAGGVDGSLFHGSPERFCAVFTQGKGTVAPAPPKPPAGLTIAQGGVSAVVRRDSGRELFVEAQSGQIWHTWIGPQSGHWAPWQSMGTPGG